MVGLLAGVAADIAGAVPEPLLLALAGLAVIEIFGKALQEITRGPLLLGPLFTFLVAASEMALLGFGSFFWALVIGLGVSLLLERDQLQELREKAQRT